MFALNNTGRAFVRNCVCTYITSLVVVSSKCCYVSIVLIICNSHICIYAFLAFRVIDVLVLFLLLLLLFTVVVFVYFYLETHDTSIDVFDDPFLSPNKACKCFMVLFHLLLDCLITLSITTNVNSCNNDMAHNIYRVCVCACVHLYAMYVCHVCMPCMYASMNACNCIYCNTTTT